MSTWWNRSAGIFHREDAKAAEGHGVLSVVCCGCGDHLRGPEPTEARYEALQISHGLCEDCFAEQMNQLREVGS